MDMPGQACVKPTTESQSYTFTAIGLTELIGMKKEPTMKSQILKGFIVYGVTVGLLSYWWWRISDNLFLLNIPGDLLGYLVYDLSIKFLGNPFSPQAHYTIPWILRIPQVFVPVSVIFWGTFGLALLAVYDKLKRL
jgi:hypothetical protein